jgi:maltodextrin utilization protein YvdJ
MLFSIYYVSPSNYSLEKVIGKTIKTKTKSFYIKSHEEKNIYSNDSPMNISNDEKSNVLVTVGNKFKSETIYLKPTDIIKLHNSNLTIKNTSDNTIHITIKFYYQ